MPIRILLLLISLFIPCLVWAGDVDIELTTDFDFSQTFVKGQQGSFSLTVTNHGSDATGSNSGTEYCVLAGTEGIELHTPVK